MQEGVISFPDRAFDVVVSEQVFEHVMDYEKAISQIHRILKRGGVAIHDFPSIWRPIESHVWVPLACYLRACPWLAIWALFGIRNSFQRGWGWKETLDRNHAWLRGHTNYLPKRKIRAIFSRWFPRVAFREDIRLAHSFGRARLLKPVRRIAAPVYGAFHERFLVTWKD